MNVGYLCSSDNSPFFLHQNNKNNIARNVEILSSFRRLFNNCYKCILYVCTYMYSVVLPKLTTGTSI